MVELGELRRDFHFEFLPQAQRELSARSVPFDAIAAELAEFQREWEAEMSPQKLGARFHFKKVHDAGCERRAILLYEIYIQRGTYRAVIAWIDRDGPGYWVSIFKKQGSAQSRASLRTAGERAVNIWRQANE